MVSLLRIPPIYTTLEPCDVAITFSDGKVGRYPRRVLEELNICKFPPHLKCPIELFELLISLKKKCLNEVAGEWIFENPRLYEDLQNLIEELYGRHLNHPFAFLKKELSSLTLGQADTVMRCFHPQSDKTEEQSDTTVRVFGLPTPYLVDMACRVINNRNLGPEYFIRKANLTHQLVKIERKLERKNLKLKKDLSEIQRARINSEVERLQRYVETLGRQLKSLEDPTAKVDLTGQVKIDEQEHPIIIRFGDESKIIYPPGLRKHLYECKFYRNGKPVESVLVLDNREYFEIFIKLIEGVPLRKQLKHRMGADIWLFERLVNVSRNFNQNFYQQIREELRYITLGEAECIKEADKVKTYLKEIASEFIHLSLFFPNPMDAHEFFRARSELFDEVQSLKKKLLKSDTEAHRNQLNEAKEKLNLMENLLKSLPISIMGLKNYARNAPHKKEEALAKINSYKSEVLFLLNMPEHLKPFVELFDYYGFFVRKIEGKTVVSFCGYKDFEFDFEYASGYQFESVLRKQIDFVFPGAGNPTYESKFDPATEEDKILSNPKLYIGRPRLIQEEVITVPISEEVKNAGEAFIAGSPRREDFEVLIKTNNWEQFDVTPDDVHFTACNFEEVPEDQRLICKLKDKQDIFIINPITLRAPLKGHNMIRTKAILEKFYKKTG